MKAIPTEYKGVRYRSKCEAQFALWIDCVHRSFITVAMKDVKKSTSITQEGCGGFEYEPKFSFGFSCDFLAWRTVPQDGDDFPVMKISLIEYKPSKPTSTYVENWRKRSLEAIVKMQLSGHQMDNTGFYIYYGNAYENTGGVFSIEQMDPRVREKNWVWCGSLRQHMLDYRFDLQGGM